MITDSNTKTRPQQWEDEAPAEPRVRRMPQSVPPTGRDLPGMPLNLPDPDDDDSPRPGGARFKASRFDRPRGAWWRPASTVGRVFLGLGLLAVLGGLATSLFLLKTYLNRDSRFRIAGTSNIEASGLTEVSRTEMLPVFGEDIGRNIFFVPLTERRKQLEQIPWVERATVMRLLPDHLQVEIVERQPVAFARQGQQFGLVDADGVLLTMPAAMMAQRHYSFPVVTGINANDPATVRKARMAIYMRLLAELDANNQKLSQQISEIDLTDPEDARVLMPEPGGDVLAHFGEDHFLERYQRYKAHIAEWRQQYPKLAATDLRYDQQVVLEMTPGTSTIEAGTDNTNATTPDKNKTAASNAEKKPVLAAPSSASVVKAASIKQVSGKTTAKKVTQAKPGAVAKPAKAGAKGIGKPASKSKTAAALTKAKEKAAKGKAQIKKHAAETKQAALNANRKKAAPVTHPAAPTVAAEGQ